jgi:uncharacterized membrane protein
LTTVAAGLRRIDLHSLFCCFWVCGFFGWCFETLVILALHGRLALAGLVMATPTLGSLVPPLSGMPPFAGVSLVWGLPVIPVYGVGGCLLSIAFRRLAPNGFAVFFGGMALLTAFEFAASYFCEIALGHRLWDYSAEAYNIQGRVCLRAALAWGFVSLFATHVLIPGAYRLYVVVRRLRHPRAFINALIAYTVLCLLVKYAIHR